jgi:iron-sulfur cluster assembly protein
MDNIDTHTTEAASGQEYPIRLTRAAISEIRRLMAEQELAENTMLRVGVQGGGCGGLTYRMEFDDSVGENDRKLEYDELTVVVDTKSLVYMDGTTIDFSRELLTGGFKFDNPLSARSCGCGTSFSV